MSKLPAIHAQHRLPRRLLLRHVDVLLLSQIPVQLDEHPVKEDGQIGDERDWSNVVWKCGKV